MNKDLKDIIEMLANVADAFTAALFLFDEQSRKLRLSAWHTLSKQLNLKVELAEGEGILGLVAKDGCAVNVSPFDQDARNLRLYLQEEAIKSFLAVPVGQQGVLCVDSKQSYTYTDKHKKLLMDFARVIQNTLAVRQVKEREKSYSRMLKLLYQIDQAVSEAKSADELMKQALAEIKAFSGADLVFFTRPNRPRTRFRVEAVEGLVPPNFVGTLFPWDSGLVGWVYKENRRLVLPQTKSRGPKSFLFSPDDPVRNFHSYMGIPLSPWGRTLGALGLVSFEPRDWTQDEIHVLTMAAHWMASSLAALAV